MLLLGIISAIVIVSCLVLVGIFYIIAKKMKKTESPLAATPPFTPPKPVAPAQKPIVKTPEVFAPSKSVQKPTLSQIEEFSVVIGSTGVSEAKELNQSVSFVRSDLLLESKTKMDIVVMKAFKKGVRSVKIIEKLPASLNISQSEIDSRIPFRVLQGNFVEFTLDPTQDVSYYLNRKLSTKDFEAFTSPIISKIISNE
jgi:hypothetical protein